MKKKILCLALVAALIVSSGCSKGSDSEQKETEAKADVTTAAEPVSNLNADGLPILKEPETFTIAVKQTSSLKSAAERQCVIDAEKATNVKIEWIEIPGASWDEKINIMLSTGDLPDAIIGNIKNMSTNYEQFADIGDMLDKYAPNVTEFFNTRDDYPQALLAPDGTIRCLPTGDESTHNMIDNQYWINDAWLKALNLELPKTTEDFENMLIAFRDKDPNGNGLKDEVPLTFTGIWGNSNSLANLFGSFGVLENKNHIFVNDDKAIFSPAQDGYYEALKYFHELYQAGLIDKEVFTVSSDQYTSNVANNDAYGVIGYYASSGNYIDALPLLTSPTSDKLMVNLNSVARNGGFSISAKCKDPEALVRWYDYINSTEELALSWGRGHEGECYDWVDVNGVKTCRFLTMDADCMSKLGYTTKPEYRNAESFGGQTPSLWRESYAQSLVYDDSWPTDYKLDWVKENLKYGYISLPAGNSSEENSERRSILLVDIDNYLSQFVSNAVINGISDDEWQNHLKTLKDLKTDEYTTLCQEFYDSVMGK